MEPVLPQDGDGQSSEPIARLGKYSLIKPLAKGGMAQVFLAQRDGAEEICVLKQLLGEVAEHETAVKRFHREAKLASYLNHRHIARVLDAGFEAGTFCIAMEYVLGKDLEAMSHHLVKQGRLLPYRVTLASIIASLDGLAYAHRATDPSGKPLKLVHRDLSPRNIMLSADGVAKVIDFGVARSDSGDFRTAPGMLVGTLRYVSPEQAVAEDVDARSDLYSLSVVLHELLSGQYVVPAGDPMKVLRFVVTEPLPLIHTFNPEIPPALSDVVQKGLAKDREDRWPDAASFRAALIEAAGPLAQAEEQHLGTFVRSFFQDEVAVGEAVISFGRQRFVRTVSSSGQTQIRSISEVTKTGYVPAAPAPEADGDEPPLLGTVVPVELTSPGVLLRSEAGVTPEFPPVPRRVQPDFARGSPTRTAMFGELEAKAADDAANLVSTMPQAMVVTEQIRVPATPAGVSRGTLLMVGVMLAVVAGATAASQMRSAPDGRRAPRSSAEATEVAPRPVANPPPAAEVERAPVEDLGPELVAPPPMKAAPPPKPRPPRSKPATLVSPVEPTQAKPAAPSGKASARARLLEALNSFEPLKGDDQNQALQRFGAELDRVAAEHGLTDGQRRKLVSAVRSVQMSGNLDTLRLAIKSAFKD